MHVVVMGVTGCGKTTAGLRIAEELRAEFVDADEFHSPDAVAKMAADVPLTDDDRWPWLDRVGEWLAGGQDRVVACSALKRAYRDAIRQHAPGAIFIHLHAPQETLEARVRRRSETTGHYAGTGLLDSQFATLEPLAPDELGVGVDVGEHDPQAVALIARAAIDAARDSGAR